MNCWLGNYIKLVTLSLKAYALREVRYAHSKLDTGFGSVVSFTLLPPYPRRKNPQFPLLRDWVEPVWKFGRGATFWRGATFLIAGGNRTVG